MSDDELGEAIARVISGAPFPSTRSRAKAREVLSLVKKAGYSRVNPANRITVEEYLAMDDEMPEEYLDLVDKGKLKD